LSSAEEGLLTVVDLKRYAYCPRIVFITSVLHLEERTSEAMELGHEEHDERLIAPLLVKLSAKRVLRALELESKTLGLVGKLDYLVVTRNRELVPVEVKWSGSAKGRAKWDHRFQLAAYAFLIEENLGSRVNRGCIYYLKDRGLVETLIDEDIRLIVRRMLREMHEMVLEERDPGIKAPLSKCINCGYLPYCRPGIRRVGGKSSAPGPLYIFRARSEGPAKQSSIIPAENPENRRSSKILNRKLK